MGTLYRMKEMSNMTAQHPTRKGPKGKSSDACGGNTLCSRSGRSACGNSFYTLISSSISILGGGAALVLASFEIPKLLCFLPQAASCLSVSGWLAQLK